MGNASVLRKLAVRVALFLRIVGSVGPRAAARRAWRLAEMRAAWLEVVLKRFADATSFASAKEMMTTLEQFDRIPLEMLRDVEPALRTKVDLREAYGVPAPFRNLLTKTWWTAS